MPAAPLPANENDRVAALLRFDVLDTEFEATYDELTELASSICGTPISLISLVDSKRQWFKSRVGLEATQTSRDYAFCAHAILQKKVFVIEDALQDERFCRNPLVVGDPHIRFYAGAPLVTSEGEVLGTLCVIDRVPREFSPEQQQALRLLAKQVMNQLELRITFQRLQQYAHQLQDTNAAKDKFFYIIAHDLRGPFNGMIGYSKLLIERLENHQLHECKEMAEEIRDGAQSTLRLVNNLLEWAMCQSGQIEYRPSTVAMDELVGEVIDLIQVMAQSKSIDLSSDGATGVKVNADRYMVFSVLQNLLHNAIKFTPPEGRIHVSLSVRDANVEIVVSDSGVGISEEVLQSLFRLEDAISSPGTQGEEGNGLGLILCKQFVEKNGGDLQVSSRLGQGSAFRFTLPRHPSEIRSGQELAGHSSE